MNQWQQIKIRSDLDPIKRHIARERRESEKISKAAKIRISSLMPTLLKNGTVSSGRFVNMENQLFGNTIRLDIHWSAEEKTEKLSIYAVDESEVRILPSRNPSNIPRIISLISIKLCLANKPGRPSHKNRSRMIPHRIQTEKNKTTAISLALPNIRHNSNYSI